MDNSCLRLRFTPLFKNIRKNNSKCCLEIVPEVSCIQNLDKIQWQQGDNSIEYTIPITYKVILKKKKESKRNNIETMKTYHSCVDLLKPSSSNDNVGYDDITKITSDTVILNKQTDNIESQRIKNEIQKMSQTECFKDAQAIEHNSSVTSYAESITFEKEIKALETKDERSKFLEMLESRNVVTSLSGDFLNQNSSADIKSSEMSCAGTLDSVSSIGVKDNRKLSIAPICSMNTDKDNPSDHVKGRTSNLIVLRTQELQFNLNLCYHLVNKLRVSENHESKVIKSMKATNTTSERVLPELRVAQFMKSVERELSPLKNKLNDMIFKCSLLGLICRDTPNPMYYRVPKGKKEMLWCQKESKSNRFVYSIVFDGQI